MNINETLTKENFWNSMMEQYPYATKDFCTWIDEYKEKVEWKKLFNDHYHRENIQYAPNGEISSIDFSGPKFHDLPYEMQQGIWICYVNNTLHRFFEQPEYEYNFDLEEDIKLVFNEIEDACKEEQTP